MSEGHWYRAYGLLLQSELALPEVLPPPAGPRPEAPDLTIRRDPAATAQWIAAGGPEAPPHAFLPAPGGGHVLRVAEVCDFWVRGGREILLAPAPGADPAWLRLFLLGSALGMALHQRGLLVLHGATVLHRRGAAIFVGDSGQGKSTLAARLGRAGHPILGDDTMPLWPTGSESAGAGFEVWPGSRVFKLWADTIGALGESPADLASVGNRLDKFFFPNAAAPADRPAPLAEVVELATAPEGAAPTLERLEGLEALRVIAAHTYRPHYVPLLGREAEHFRHCSRVAGAVTVWRLSRPWDLGRLAESLALLSERWGAPVPAGAEK